MNPGWNVQNSSPSALNGATSTLHRPTPRSISPVLNLRFSDGCICLICVFRVDACGVLQRCNPLGWRDVSRFLWSWNVLHLVQLKRTFFRKSNSVVESRPSSDDEALLKGAQCTRMTGQKTSNDLNHLQVGHATFSLTDLLAAKKPTKKSVGKRDLPHAMNACSRTSDPWSSSRLQFGHVKI